MESAEFFDRSVAWGVFASTAAATKLLCICLMPA
jgi:hypothetical protein